LGILAPEVSETRAKNAVVSQATVHAMSPVMETNTAASPGQGWIFFSLLTVCCWGLYGVFLHTGQLGMNDPVNGRYKAFLWVGIAYFLTAVLAPLALLLIKGAPGRFLRGSAGRCSPGFWEPLVLLACYWRLALRGHPPS
jgi:hypothetical protein